jgi:hypothetical protein
VQYLRSILVLALVVSALAEDNPTASQIAAFEQFATQPSTRVAWSTEGDVIESGGARATIAAVVMEDKTAWMRRALPFAAAMARAAQQLKPH